MSRISHLVPPSTLSVFQLDHGLPVAAAGGDREWPLAPSRASAEGAPETPAHNALAGLARPGRGDDTLTAEAPVDRLEAGRGDDVVSLGSGGAIRLGRGDDTLTATGAVETLSAGRGDDQISLASGGAIRLGRGDDALTATGAVENLWAGRGDDDVSLGSGGAIRLGRGDDTLAFSGRLDSAFGGRGEDALIFDANLGDYDIAVGREAITFSERFSGHELVTDGFETFVFNDRDLDAETLRETFDPARPTPTILVGGGTQTVTVNDPDPTLSVIWDRTVQQAVIETDGPAGPTVASRAYALVHTAIYDAWAAFDDLAVRVSRDGEGDNPALLAATQATEATEANQAEAMSYAAYRVLTELFPDQAALFAEVMEGRFGLDPDGDSAAAAVGIDAAEDLMALRLTDGANQAGGYDAAGLYTPVNPNPFAVNDITRWTPENVPIDPEGELPVEQSFLTPQWGGVESFALPELANGATDHAALRPPPPQPFFAEGFAGSVLNFTDKTITLSQPAAIGGARHAAGEAIPVSKALIGPVVNPDFIAQAEEVVAFSANLTDERKIVAEFWEDGGGTAFPPGTFMTFAQFVSARDDHDLGADARMFLAMGNAVFDAGVAAWDAKTFYDYARPVRVIRDLGELGLIGEPGVDELTGEAGHVIEAFGGFDPATGAGLGTRTILAETFTTFQRPAGNPSPPFAEYTSGHSGFSAAGAEVLGRFTGSDAFGGAVVFAPGSTQFEIGVPILETALSWETFSDAADEAGLSRLYGGIHFSEGDLNGRQLGREAGASAFELAERFWSGTATDADRPFHEEASLL